MHIFNPTAIFQKFLALYNQHHCKEKTSLNASIQIETGISYGQNLEINFESHTFKNMNSYVFCLYWHKINQCSRLADLVETVFCMTSHFYEVASASSPETAYVFVKLYFFSL